MLKTVKRAVQVLLVLAERPEGMTLTELTQAIRSNKATVHRLVRTLMVFHLVELVGPTRKLHLGSGILALAAGVFREADIREAARPHLTRLRDQTGETACLHAAFGYERACVEQVESPAEIKWVAEIGKKFPLTAGAPGKVLLAFLPPQERKRILKIVPLARLTPDSITDRRQFDRALDQVRRDGYAISINESVPGAAACAAPIYDRTGRVVAAITVSGPVARLSSKKLHSYSALVRRAAAEISKEL